MKEIWEQALLSYNLPLTFLLGLVMVYWLLSAFGAVDADTFDVDFDIDADIDLDVDADVQGDHSGGSFFGGIMKFVNAQDIPVMIILSILILSMWLISILSNYYLNPAGSELIALALLAGNFVASVFVVKGITQPLRPMMRAIKYDADTPPPIVGSVGIVKSRVLDQHFGQVEVTREKGAPALVNCRLRDDDEPQLRGSEVLIYDFDKEKDRYLVRSTNLTDNITNSPSLDSNDNSQSYSNNQPTEKQ